MSWCGKKWWVSALATPWIEVWGSTHHPICERMRTLHMLVQRMVVGVCWLGRGPACSSAIAKLRARPPLLGTERRMPGLHDPNKEAQHALCCNTLRWQTKMWTAVRLAAMRLLRPFDVCQGYRTTAAMNWRRRWGILLRGGCQGKRFRCPRGGDIEDKDTAAPDLNDVECMDHAQSLVSFNPHSIAQYLARRSGVDFRDKRVAWDGATQEGWDVGLSIVRDDAMERSAYDAVERLLVGRQVELVLVDPPFGLQKHGDESWDLPQRKWVPATFPAAALAGLPFFAGHFNIAVYCMHQDIGEWMRVLNRAGDVLPYKHRGNVLFVLGRDGTAHLQAGTASSGHRYFVVVGKYGNGADSVQADAGSPLGGRFVYSFPSPATHTRYGRAELDAVVGMHGKAVNPTQKPLEETRLLIRQLSPNSGAVVSLCNGTGSALIAAGMEGRWAAGLENSATQCEWARRRVETFFAREHLLCVALRCSGASSAPEVRQLKAAATVRGIPDQRVRGTACVIPACVIPRPTLCVVLHIAFVWEETTSTDRSDMWHAMHRQSCGAHAHCRAQLSPLLRAAAQ